MKKKINVKINIIKIKYLISLIITFFSGVDTPIIFMPEIITFEIAFIKISLSSDISFLLFINRFSGFSFPRFNKYEIMKQQLIQISWNTMWFQFIN